MSLILLRKDCDPVLAGHGLGMMHIEVRNKTMVLVGKCGQTVAAINSIRFSSDTRFSAEEREYSVQLLSEYINEHIRVLKQYIKAQTKYKKMEKPELSGELVESLNIGPTMGNNSKIRISSIVYKQWNIYFGADSKINNISVRNGQGNKGDLSEVLDALPALLEEAEAILESYVEYVEAGKEVNTIRGKLSPSCTI